MRPSVKFLSAKMINQIIDHACEILIQKGIHIENERVIEMLSSSGAKIEGIEKRVFFTRDLIEKAIHTVPGCVNLFDASGKQTHILEKENVYFTPGSSALFILEGPDNIFRKPLTEDYINYIKVISQLDAIAAQSTAFIPDDVPGKIADSYRLFLSLLYSEKPVVTGAFTIESFELMKNLLITIRGSRTTLKNKPLSIFSCCPTSPLKWSEVTSQNLIDCAEYSIPVEIIAMPLAGFIAPVSLYGTLVQHTAETLSGIIIAQTANPGTPLLYGGSPAIFDMRFQTAPMGAIETMMIDCAYNEIGKKLGIPTQAYISLSDAKLLDAQAGLETGIGSTLAALAGINSISGPGMLDFENCFSIEKLIVDNEICQMTYQMLNGIETDRDMALLPLVDELLTEGHLLASEHTMLRLHSEHRYPGPVIERNNRSGWSETGGSTVPERAADRFAQLLKSYTPVSLAADQVREMVKLMESEAKKFSMNNLPQRTD